VLGGHLGVGNLHVLVVVFITHKIVTLSITWVFDPAMIIQVDEGEVANMLLLDLEKLDNKELNDSTEMAGGRKVWIFYHIWPQTNDTKNIM
jgi:hypothetical protein